jgi:hypothetical protein
MTEFEKLLAEPYVLCTAGILGDCRPQTSVQGVKHVIYVPYRVSVDLASERGRILVPGVMFGHDATLTYDPATGTAWCIAPNCYDPDVRILYEFLTREEFAKRDPAKCLHIDIVHSSVKRDEFEALAGPVAKSAFYLCGASNTLRFPTYVTQDDYYGKWWKGEAAHCTWYTRDADGKMICHGQADLRNGREMNRFECNLIYERGRDVYERWISAHPEMEFPCYSGGSTEDLESREKQLASFDAWARENGLKAFQE